MWGEVLRLSATLPEEPRPARRGRRPHDPTALAEARRLVETSVLPYRAIARITGVPRATLSRHALEGGWLRPPGGETPAMSAEGERRMRRGELADRVLRAAEAQVLRVELDPAATLTDFSRAARILALAQRLDRPGMPRSRVSRARRVKGDANRR